MSRTKLTSSLPPLPLDPPLDRCNRAGDLSHKLHEAAVNYQTDKPQVFYTLREIAARFRVPPSMVAAIYRQMENEGYITRLRGSKTRLEARGVSRQQLLVHAIVAVPVALAAFAREQKVRAFVVSLMRELRQRGFVATGVTIEESAPPAQLLAERIKATQADTVIWYSPDRCARDTAAILRDAGIRVLGISDGKVPSIPCLYEVIREHATRSILNVWGADKSITRLSVIEGRDRNAFSWETLGALLDEVKVPFEVVRVESERAAILLNRLVSRKGDAFILLPDAASLFSFRDPRTLIELMRTSRVALLGGPVSFPMCPVPPDCHADIVMADWQKLAGAIAHDLLNPEVQRVNGSWLFDAKAYLRAPLRKFAQYL